MPYCMILYSKNFFFGFVTMHETTTRSATRPPLRASGGGGSLQRHSGSARRRIRQAVAWHRAGFALGEGLPRGVDAATLHLQATQQRERPWAAADAAEAAAHVNANGRQRRSNERAAENRARRAKAEAIRLRNVFSTWHQQLEHPNVRG